MTITDWIQIAAVLVTLTTSIVAIIISGKSLKLTRLSIEEANRPYVVLYETDIQVGESKNYYLVLKNFGKTGATIDYIQYCPAYNNLRSGEQPFIELKNHFIAPDQQISCGILKTDKTKSEKRTFRIKYHDTIKTYRETITLNEPATDKNFSIKTTPSETANIEKVIRNATEEMLRRNL